MKPLGLALVCLLLVLDFARAQTPADSTPANTAAPAAPMTVPEQQPNILFVLCDDLGFGDVSISGNPYIKTPNIDELAKHSIICTNGYAAYPVCMPSRISILTGRYSDRTGARMNSFHPGPPKPDQPWLPALLKTAGYTTGAIGKWHIGGYSAPRAKLIGFDDWAIPVGAWWHYFDFKVYRPEGAPTQVKTYSTDFLSDEAIKFIDKNANGSHPFFLYLAYNAPHFPLEAPEADIAPFKDKAGVSNGAAVIYGMVTHLDRRLGDVLAELKAKGIYDNTLIVFTSDNGPEFSHYKGLDQKRWNADLAGWKGRVLEGGIKVPVFVSWPKAFGSNPPPYNGVVDGIDWQPTLCAAAKVSPSAQTATIDGVNLLPHLLHQSNDPVPARFWSYNTIRPTVYSNGALREGDWKLVRPAIETFSQWGHPGDTPLPDQIPGYQLFNLAQDPDEKHDLAAEQPDRVEQMKTEFEATFQSVESGPDNAAYNQALKDMNKTSGAPGLDLHQSATTPPANPAHTDGD